MKWVAAAIVVFSFLYGVSRGWRGPHPDPIYLPFSGFLMGLFIVWLTGGMAAVRQQTRRLAVARVPFQQTSRLHWR
jgi:hypothetical protein